MSEAGRPSRPRERLERLRAWFTALWQGPDGPLRPQHLAGLLCLGLVYTTVYLGHSKTPGVSPDSPKGWWNWQDQKIARAAAEALSSGTYGAEEHFYPPAYPLLGSFFVDWMPEHLFFVPNLLFAVGIGACLWLLACRFVDWREASLFLLVTCFAAQHALVKSLLPPWTTIPTHFLAYLMVWIGVTYRPSLRWVLGLSALEALIFVFRPGDALYLGSLLVLAVALLPTWRERGIAATAGLGIVAIGPLVDMASNWIVEGAMLSEYEAMHSTGFSVSRLPVVAYTTLLDGGPVYRETKPVVLERMPWILLAGPGMVWAVREQGRQWLFPSVAALGCIGFYLCYANLSPVGLYEFALIHYITMSFPLFALFAWLTLRYAMWALPWRWSVPLLAIPIALAWCLRLEEVTPLPATVGPQGEILIDGRPRGKPYDLIVIKGWPYTSAAEMSRNGVEVRRGYGLHWRRNIWLGNALDGWELHVAPPFEPEEITLAAPYLRGEDIELRRLRWRLGPVPPMLMKWWTGDRLWGVDDLDRTLEWSASQMTVRPPLRPASEDDTDDAWRATYTRYSIGSIPLVKGRYRAAWLGLITRKTPAHAAAMATVRGETTELRLEGANAVPGTFAGKVEKQVMKVDFKVTDKRTQMELVLWLPPGHDIELTRMVLRHPNH